MSVKEAKVKEGDDLKNSDLPLTKIQALAVAWSGLEVLAKMGACHILYDTDGMRAVIVIDGTRPTEKGFVDA